MSHALRQYIMVTLSYWGFTITDGALRMLVVLYFHQLGYSPFEVAALFLFYEFFGMVTNLFGGWLAARTGLNTTLHIGLTLQMLALGMLLVDPSWLSVIYVMAAQALSGIAKDLNKMSAKSSIKLLLPDNAQGKLYHWIALLTGSKNTLKGAGFFLGALLLSSIGFRAAIVVLFLGLMLVCIASFLLLDRGMGKSQYQPKFHDLFSKSPAINRLSAARFFLFGSRDIWFVVALPVYLQSELNWDYTAVGSLLALWIIAYGAVQAVAPKITARFSTHKPDGKTALHWVLPLSLIPAAIALALHYTLAAPAVIIIIGLAVFGILFAINSSLHSYLIVAYAQRDGVSLDVGFYYMANAAGRLAGSLLSGLIYQWQGLEACMLVASGFIVAACLLSMGLAKHQPQTLNQPCPVKTKARGSISPSPSNN
ncbi:MAG: organoarsenical effux MFS transporter ArsJ [Gammaproteobacteria bacterium]|nr:organoarsenical effux MFS transporter ArsJ [Gammaproteobacteria bacterium]MBQ0838981.1 organoarsenical effux MFS transporter ArsJ [Gammaproteobacteria bacterium]